MRLISEVSGCVDEKKPPELQFDAMGQALGRGGKKLQRLTP